MVIEKLNRVGDKIEPWRTPLLIKCGEVVDPLKTADMGCFKRNIFLRGKSEIEDSKKGTLLICTPCHTFQKVLDIPHHSKKDHIVCMSKRIINQHQLISNNDLWEQKFSAMNLKRVSAPQHHSTISPQHYNITRWIGQLLLMIWEM